MRKFFKCDFSRVSDEKLAEYNLMLRELEYAIPAESAEAKEAWDTFYHMGCLVRNEISRRKEAKKAKKAKKKVKGEAVMKKTMLVKPLKGRKLKIL